MKVIASKFGFRYPLSEQVKQVDREQLQYEWDVMMLLAGNFPTPLTPKQAENKFLRVFNQITRFGPSKDLTPLAEPREKDRTCPQPENEDEGCAKPKH